MKKQILTIAILITLSIKGLAQTNSGRASADSNFSIQLIGDANSFKTLSESGSTPANASVGLLYTKYFKAQGRPIGKKVFHSAEISINYNVASSADTLKAAYDANKNLTSKSNFGSSILLPGNSSQSTMFNAKVYFGRIKDSSTIEYYDLKKMISGFYVNFNHAARNWFDSSKNIKASSISLSAGLFYDFIDYKARDSENKKVKSVYVGIGYTGRWIVGDIALDENDNFRKRLLGAEKLSFHGVEFTLGAKIENARIELKIPILSGSTQVPGLSGAQPNYQIGFSGGITIK
jgi:hypothetical protein